MIELTDVTKRYGSTLAVDHLGFEVRPGEVTGFLGPNGAGKSTTMRMIVGLDAPTSGRVTVALVGLLFILPIVTGFLPASFMDAVGKYFPAQAGMAIFSVVPDPRALSPWAGFAVLLAYGFAALAVGGLTLVRRDP